MRTGYGLASVLGVVLLGGGLLHGTAFGKEKPIVRVATVTGLKPEKAEYYRKLHAAPWPKVLKRLKDSNIRNYSIYQKDIEGKPYLFSYFEYTGKDWDRDMARVGKDETIRKWWKETDPCQDPLPRAAKRNEIWDGMEEVFHTDGASDVKPAKQVQRFGTITGLKPEKEAHYRTLHATAWPEVLRQIKAAHVRNYSIYLKDIGDKLYLFSYFEYVGDDFKGDMARLAADPTIRRWWKQTDPCQLPFPEAGKKGEIWEGMDEVFYME